jgi:hypothetical protein
VIYLTRVLLALAALVIATAGACSSFRMVTR